MNTHMNHPAQALSKPPAKLDLGAFLASGRAGRTTATYKRGQPVLNQGDAAIAVYYIDRGTVRIMVTSKSGKEGVVAILGPGEFFGEECLAGQPLYLTTPIALQDATVIRIDRDSMARLLRESPEFSQLFIGFLLSRHTQIEADLVDHLCNSSEKRLARVLLLLANSGKDDNTEPVIPKISQDLLAARVGTTRSRINYFMNKFRKLGYIEYAGTIRVNSALLATIFKD